MTPPHLNDQQLAAFVDGQLADDERAEVVRHLDGCPTCLDRVAALAALADAPSPEVPAALLARAARPRTLWPVRIAAYGTAAAAVLLAVAIWPSRELSTTTASPTAPLEPAAQVRAGASSSLAVDAPADGDRVEAGFEVRWRGLDSVVFYEVKVTTASGDLVWSGRVDGTTERLAVPSALPEAAPCYLWVTAHLPEGRRLASNVVRVQGRPAS